jgi:hypothetical protein
MKDIIISRHPAAVEFVRRERPELVDAPVVAQATAEDVRGRRVFGNLPLSLAAVAAEVWVIEFSGDPASRGQEYDLAAMDAAGAHLVGYVIRAVPAVAAAKPVLVWDAESSNGRWGLKVYAPSAEVVQKTDGLFFAPGFAAEVRGEVSGRKIIFLVPDANTTAVWGDGLEAEAGADEVLSMDLQSHRQVAVCNAEPGAQLRLYGYKRRWDQALVIDAVGRLREAEDLEVLETRRAEAAARDLEAEWRAAK